MRFTVDEVAAATGGTTSGAPASGSGATVVDGVGVDSRSLSGGELFVALVAERDGHDFVPAAVDAGAAAALVAREVPQAIVPQVLVPETSAALLDLGRHARARLPDRVVGITGSVGKTSTKDLLAAVLATAGPAHASARSFNNEVGVPLTLAGAPEDAASVVVEMGARGPGHVALLCEVARPTVGVVTVVAGAHLEMFGTVDAVAEAKGELVAALRPGATAALNADDARVAAMASRAGPGVDVVRFGEGPQTEVRAEAVELDGEVRPRFRLRTPWGDADVRLAAHGRHQVVNALAAASAALALGVPLADVAGALAAGRPSEGRMTLRRAASGATVIDDSYNANPTSTRAALAALTALPARRRVAVLGTMAELGAGGPEEHRAIAREARERGVAVVAVGEPAYGAVDAAVADVGEAIAALAAMDLTADDAVLVKASRVAALDRVVAHLVTGGAGPAG